MLATRNASEPARPSTSGLVPLTMQSRNEFDLVGQTVLLGDFMRLGGDGGQPLGHGVAAQAVAEDLALAQIAIEIVAAPEHSHSPLGLVAHSARRDIGNATRRKGDARIGQVDVAADHRRAHRVDTFHRRIRQTDDHIDVVDHQVEHHVHLDAAIPPRRDAVALEIKRVGHHFGERAIGAGEALDMADLKHAVALCSKLGERVRAGYAVGDRLFDQHVKATLDQLARDVVMQRRRHGDAHRIHPANQTAIVGCRLGAELRGHRGGARRVTIDHGDKLGAGIARIMIGMEAAEISGPHHRGANTLCHVSATPAPTLTEPYSAACARLILREASASRTVPTTRSCWPSVR